MHKLPLVVPERVRAWDTFPESAKFVFVTPIDPLSPVTEMAAPKIFSTVPLAVMRTVLLPVAGLDNVKNVIVLLDEALVCHPMEVRAVIATPL